MTPPNFDEHISFQSLSAESMLKINSICDQFELEWNHAQPTELEAFIKTNESRISVFNEKELLVLGLELSALDREYRIKNHLPIREEVYKHIFPSLTNRSSHSLTVDRSSTVADHDIQEGQLIGDYRIISRIGSGGMGQVYRAEHLLMKRSVAIKFLSNRIKHDQHAQRRFEREMTSLATLSHPNIVAAYDARRDQNHLFLVTEWIDGIDLSKHVRQHGPLSVELAVRCCKQASQALHYAHGRGIIHRDVKPSNMLLAGDGTLKLLDLGLAKVLWEANDETAASDALTKSTLVLGTASFISPEQARNPLNIDARSDIYSLGCTLFYLLSGHPPYQADHAVDLLAAHLQAPIPKLCEENREVPEELSELVARMMSKLPTERPTSMNDVESSLDSLGGNRSNPQPLTAGMPLKSLRVETRDLRNAPSYRFALVLASLACLLMIVWLAWFGPNKESLRRIEQSNTTGIVFNGLNGYAEALDFNVPLRDSAILEVAVTPLAGPLPSNVVAWTGENSLILFLNPDRRWGGALHHGDSTQLQVSRLPLELGQERLLAVRLQDSRIELFEEGKRIESVPIQYVLESTKTSLFFGGTPSGMFAADRTNRFFTGHIHKVHVGRGETLVPITSIEDFLPKSTSVAFFDLREGTGDIARDAIKGYKATLHNVNWLDEQ